MIILHTGFTAAGIGWITATTHENISRAVTVENICTELHDNPADQPYSYALNLSFSLFHQRTMEQCDNQQTTRCHVAWCSKGLGNLHRKLGDIWELQVRISCVRPSYSHWTHLFPLYTNRLLLLCFWAPAFVFFFKCMNWFLSRYWYNANETSG